MHLLPDGDIRACCRNSIPLGNITEQRLPEIWEGARRAEMRRRLGIGETPEGCANCASEIAAEGRRGSYPEVFDYWVDRLHAADRSPMWPTRLELNLSNHCNLQCSQCSGDLSSAIRIHREGRPALPQVYDDQFFDDLRLFLPHLRHANFAGGEPFLGAENFRVWEMIAETVPDLDCTINTNATQWNRRIEQVLDRGRFSFIFSLDGITKPTYESIRVGADLDEVLTNIERFRAYAALNGTDVNINHCLMPQNHHEFGQLLLYAEHRSIQVNCSVVRTPRECSIAYLPQDEIRSIHRTLKLQEHDLLPQLRLNASTWLSEVRRIGVWAKHGPPVDPDGADETTAVATPTVPMEQHVEVQVRTRQVPVDATPIAEPPQPAPTLLGLQRRGSGPSDDTEVLHRLRSTTPGSTVHTVTVGDDEIVTSCSTSVLDLLRVDVDDLVGQPIAALDDLTARRFGARRHEEMHQAGPDRIEGRAVFDDVEARVVIVALRDDQGWAHEARILIALDPRRRT